MDTHFAPADLETREKIIASYAEIKAFDYLQELINALPYIAVILNDKRQIVYSNKALLDGFGFGTIEEILGLRPGEAIHCIHSGNMPGGCGTSENCQYCAAASVILECQKELSRSVEQCRIISRKNGVEEWLDIEVTAAPFKLNQTQYTILAIKDISAEKRKEALEKIFFHDVLNTAGTLQGMVDLLKQLSDRDKIREFIKLLGDVTTDLTDEIITQRSLISAENGELKVSLSELETLPFLEHLSVDFSNHKIAENKNILLEKNAENITAVTDPVLLRRILVNMLKNAAEASENGQEIAVSCSKSNSKLQFHVRNQAYMPREVQMQIFQRSYSTKGRGRGLGTYSMKLLGERYLKGKVWFETDRQKGTIFYLSIPLVLDP